MASRSAHKKDVFLDRFIKRYCCSADNHPSGWRWWKKKAQKKYRKMLKEEIRKEIL